MGGKERLDRIAGDRLPEIRVLRSSWYVEGSYCIAVTDSMGGSKYDEFFTANSVILLIYDHFSSCD